MLYHSISSFDKSHVLSERILTIDFLQSLLLDEFSKTIIITCEKTPSDEVGCGMNRADV